MWVAQALDADVSVREDECPQVLHPQPLDAAPVDTICQRGLGRGRKLATENSTPVSSGSVRFREHAQDSSRVLGMSFANSLSEVKMLYCKKLAYLNHFEVGCFPWIIHLDLDRF